MNPTLAAPFRRRLVDIDAEIVERAVEAELQEFCAREAAVGKLLTRVGHVFCAEDAEREHLRRRQFRPEIFVEIFPVGANSS
jgi:hypothetical protein